MKKKQSGQPARTKLALDKRTLQVMGDAQLAQVAGGEVKSKPGATRYCTMI